MARVLFCKHCGAGEPVVGGDVPRLCPHCGHDDGWTTMAPTTPIEPAPAAAIKFTRDDRIFLRVNRIAADD